MARTRTRPLSRFGVALEKALKAKGISGAELCRRIDVHQTTVWRWMVSDTGPRADLASKIAEELGCSLSALVASAKSAEKTVKPRGRKKKSAAAI